MARTVLFHRFLLCHFVTSITFCPGGQPLIYEKHNEIFSLIIWLSVYCRICVVFNHSGPLHTFFSAPTAVQLSYCLWVLLIQPPIPGHYWFVITGVAVQPLFGLKISLQIVRYLQYYIRILHSFLLSVFFFLLK